MLKMKTFKQIMSRRFSKGLIDFDDLQIKSKSVDCNLHPNGLRSIFATKLVVVENLAQIQKFLNI